RGGRPMLAGLEPGYPKSAAWRSLLTLKLNAFGVSVSINNLQTDWRYRRTADGAVFTGALAYVPDVEVTGRLLGVLPAGWIEGASPVTIEGTVDDFMAVLTSSNNGDGAQFAVNYDDA